MSKITPLILAAALAIPVVGFAEVTQEEHDELERKVDVLTEELENMRLGQAADTVTYERRRGFAPAASKVYNIRRGVSVGGYGEVLLQDYDRDRQDDRPATKIDQLDMLRQILYVGYKFNDELLFNSEIEFEHAGTGGSTLQGEVSVELAYIDWSVDPRIGARGGILLMPVGITNELHEPPTFIGARRPDVDNLIIPTTWRVNGAGVFGEFENGVEYRAYVTEGFDAMNFRASSPVRGGRQKGSKSKFTNPAVVGRVDWRGPQGLLVGASAYSGDSWQELTTDSVSSINAVTTIAEAHVTLEYRGLDARMLYAHGWQNDAGLLSDEMGLTGMNRLGEQFHGFYFEAAYNVLPLTNPDTRFSLEPYFRYETIDTQKNVPGGMENPAYKSSVFTVGAAFRPHPNVITKIDRQLRRNDADTATSQWNAQLGWMF